MVKENTKAPVNSADFSEDSSLEKIRWSLRQRLCEHMRHLSADLFDELDDFLFNSVQPEELGEGSSQLKLVREFRNKRQLFEELFLASIDGALQSTLVPKQEHTNSDTIQNQVKASSSAYEKMEIDLALERMQRKAFKHYTSRIKQLGNTGKSGSDVTEDSVIPVNRDILIKNTLRALAVSHGVFLISLENRLVFLKLFEKHFLLKMDKLYQDVISIVNNKDNQAFIERLYSSSTSIHKRREKSRIAPAGENPQTTENNEPLSGSRRIVAAVDELLKSWCDDNKLPEFVESMLKKDWHGVMFLMGLNKGVGTREWSEAKETVDLLLQLVSGSFVNTGTGSSFDRLRERLQQGFELAQKSASEQQAFFVELEKLYAGTGSSKGDNTSLESESGEQGNAQKSTRTARHSYAAVSEAGRKILDNDDLDDFVALLSDDQEQAIAELEEEAISMDYYLNMVDTMADGSKAEVQNGKVQVACIIKKSTSIANSYQVLDERGRVLLTRGRVGLAVSLRAGEIRLQGQQDFNQAQLGKSQLVAVDQARNEHPTAH